MKSRLAVVATTALVASALLVSPTDAAQSSVLEESVGGLFDGREVVELSAPVPDWYTPALDREVKAAGRKGVPIPATAGAEYSGLAFTGIRPGAWIISPAGCTTNFVFGSPGNYHIGTAGHCTEVNDEVTLVALPGVLMNIGRTVLSVDEGIGRDFALIQIYPEMQELVNPSMSYFGGPTGSSDPAVGDVVLHSGHGVVIGTGGTPRAGLVTYVGEGDTESSEGGGGGNGGGNGNGGGEKDCDKGNGNGGGQECKENSFSLAALTRRAAGSAALGWDGAASPGDSGSAVRNAFGAAAGNLTHLVVGTKYLPAFIVGTTAPFMEALAGMPIASASLVPDPLT